MRRSAPPLDRFVSYTEKTDGCWLWTGATTRDGYGQLWLYGKSELAHRVSYAMFVGPIPEGLTVDHICWTPLCVNPEHLRLLTHPENARRQRSALKTHCVNDHEFTPENTYRRRDGTRDCRACIRERQARRKTKREVAS